MSETFTIKTEQPKDGREYVMTCATREDILDWCLAQSCIDTVAMLKACLRQLKERTHIGWTQGLDQKLLFSDGKYCLVLDPPKSDPITEACRSYDYEVNTFGDDNPDDKPEPVE